MSSFEYDYERDNDNDGVILATVWLQAGSKIEAKVVFMLSLPYLNAVTPSPPLSPYPFP
jgi:hypothetical protein